MGKNNDGVLGSLKNRVECGLAQSNKDTLGMKIDNAGKLAGRRETSQTDQDECDVLLRVFHMVMTMCLSLRTTNLWTFS